MDNVESALTSPKEHGSGYQRIKYREIRELEPVGSKLTESKIDGFYLPLVYLFRSRIEDYDRDCEDFFLLITALLRDVTPLSDDEIATIGSDKYKVSESPEIKKMYVQFSPPVSGGG